MTALARPDVRSTTRRGLLRLRAALLGVTALVLLSSWYAFDNVHDTIDTVRDRSAPALLEAAVARSALAEADSVAIRSFSSGEAQLIGPGDRYQNQIAVASQAIAQVAEDNTLGEAGSKQLRVVAGLVVAYTGWVEQADAHYRQGGGSTSLAAVDLWYASRLLHEPESGVLAQFDELVKAQHDALGGQLSGSSTTFWRGLLVAVPILALLVLLVVAQRFLRHRFRRSWNLPLVFATVVLAGCGAITVFGVLAQQEVETAADELRQVTSTWDGQITTTRAEAQEELKNLVTKICAAADGGCGDTVVRFLSDLRQTGTPEPVPDKALTDAARHVNASVAAADDYSGLETLLPIGAVLIGLAVLLGLHPRIQEYRYERR
ncbi:hypothetical protein JNUCC0626_06230 [Lentzea sp. JNUCC 0626]|uniref:hypothetical protein n=1 Tax=Lentzea sp. JNUCC 0626 TaxID=3367513 RepID=UPI003747EF9E